ncbi:MAG: PAS-domain containing protein [Planctomycetes bacterium]|nr:PAS-domain containing protein [Planctomycetota bacterium]
MLSRLLVILFCVAILFILDMAKEAPERPYHVFAVLAVLAMMNGGFLLLLPFVKRKLSLFVLFQFMLDIVAITAMVFFTGGTHSNFVNLYYLCIMVASVLLSRRMSGLFASLATVGLALVAALYLSRTGMWLVDRAYDPGTDVDVRGTISRMLLTVLAFFTVAYLSGLLADRLEHAKVLNEEILQNMAEGVAVFDSDNRVVFVNDEFNEIFGNHDNPIQLGTEVSDIFPGRNSIPLMQLIESRTSARFELPSREEEGESLPPVEIRTSILGNSSSPSGMIMIAIDLSLRERAELAERRADRFSAVSEMAAGLAHEIRNPLASVRGSIQEISRDFEDGSPNKKLAGIVMKESDRLDKIITNFLQYARQRNLKPVNCRLGSILSEIKMLIENRPDANGVEIELTINDDPWIRCDQDLLRDVFMNLAVNALAALDGKGKLRINYPEKAVRRPGTVIMRKGEGGVCVSFIDTGPGLPPGMEEKVFEPFYTTKSRGSGLGLSIARRTVESHDGEIWMNNRPEGGTAVYCWLPLSGPFTRGTPELPSVDSDKEA